MNTEFNDHKHYNQEMAKSAYDKLAFVNKIYENIDLIVDFGCADGTVTRFIQLFYPGVKVIGYDLPEIIEQNADVLKATGTDYSISPEAIANIVTRYHHEGKKSLLVMNSVHHEIFNYMAKETKLSLDGKDIPGYDRLLKFWYNIGFDYIFIRDMNIKIPTSGKYVDLIPEFFMKLHKKLIDNSEFTERYISFTDVYNNEKPLNPLDKEDQEKMVHFLLKCRYKENWDRELHEDYTAHDCEFPIDGLFLSTVFKFPYHMTDVRSYVLPYVEYINRKDFGISLRGLGITTHSQCLFKRNSDHS